MHFGVSIDKAKQIPCRFVNVYVMDKPGDLAAKAARADDDKRLEPFFHAFFLFQGRDAARVCIKITARANFARRPIR